MAKAKKIIPWFAAIIVASSLAYFLLSARFMRAQDIAIRIGDLNNTQWVTGMRGAENILLGAATDDFYVTDLGGSIYRVRGDDGRYSIAESRKVGNYALGMAWANREEGELFVGVSSDDWLDPGSSLYRLSADLRDIARVTGDYPGLNGATTDAKGNLYVTTGDFNFINPKGSLVKIGLNENDTLLAKAKSANGLLYDAQTDSLYYSEVYSGIYAYDLSRGEVSKVLGKSKIVEGFDDFCIDGHRNIWIADPPSGFIKCYMPERKTVYRVRIAGFGVASSCRVRKVRGEEFLFITEIKQEKSKEYDGRGVLIVPVEELLRNF